MEMKKEPKYADGMTLTNRFYYRCKVLVPKPTSIFFIILYLSMSPLLSLASELTSVGSISTATGEAYIYHEDESPGVDVIVQALVYPGDLIVTSERSRKYLLLEKEGKRVALFKLLGGMLRALPSKGFGGKGSSFQIETSDAIAEVRGTDFIISMTEKGTEIVALSGEVYVRNASPSIPGEVVLKAGFGITVQRVWVLSEPVMASEERLKNIIEETHIPVIVPEEEKVAGCVACHQLTYSTMIRQKVVHPGAERDCKRCHIKQAEKVEEIPVETYAMESLILLDVEEKTSWEVRVRVKDRAGREAVSERVSFTPSTLTTEMINDNMPPLISNLRVEELREGVFYSTVLAWDTDKPCTSAVEFGLPDTPVTLLSLDDQYTKDHRMTVGGLSPGRDYILRAISKDPFGNTATSEDLRVEIKNPFTRETDEPDVFPSVEKVSVVKVGEKTALRWKTNMETVAVVDLSAVITEAPSNEPHFPGFADPEYRGLYGCLTKDCHEGKIHRGRSHPTGTLSWRKVKAPTDLPLVGGSVMLCITCHTPHGGEHIHRLRKAELELCASCH
jgi:predicted CXXCH cytochrome family protein